MEKKVFISIVLLMVFCSCNNRANRIIESMSERSAFDSTMFVKIPQNMYLSDSDRHSIMFSGSNKFVKIMIVESDNGWNLEGFAQDIVGDNRSKLTLVEKKDSIIAYEIHKGVVSMPALMFSVCKRGNVSVMLITMGLDLEVHNAIRESIICNVNSNNDGKSTYIGSYLNIEYPSSWIVDEFPDTQTADVSIMQEDRSFGVWLFRFEKEYGNNSFNDIMNGIADNWREYADVDVDYVQINNMEWCKQDIRMNMQDYVGRQISYYTLKGDYIYNVKFGNSSEKVDKNLNLIDSMMVSVVIK